MSRLKVTLRADASLDSPLPVQVGSPSTSKAMLILDVLTGPPGLSAYQMWLAQGNTGTEQDFLDSLKGPAGIGGATYTHIQATPAGEWIVNHNLGLMPAFISVMDILGNGLDGFDVQHVSNSQTRLYFNPPAAGSARLS